MVWDLKNSISSHTVAGTVCKVLWYSKLGKKQYCATPLLLCMRRFVILASISLQVMRLYLNMSHFVAIFFVCFSSGFDCFCFVLYLDDLSPNNQCFRKRTAKKIYSARIENLFSQTIQDRIFWYLFHNFSRMETLNLIFNWDIFPSLEMRRLIR